MESSSGLSDWAVALAKCGLASSPLFAPLHNVLETVALEGVDSPPNKSMSHQCPLPADININSTGVALTTRQFQAKQRTHDSPQRTLHGNQHGPGAGVSSLTQSTTRLRLLNLFCGREGEAVEEYHHCNTLAPAGLFGDESSSPPLSGGQPYLKMFPANATGSDDHTRCRLERESAGVRKSWG